MSRGPTGGPVTSVDFTSSIKITRNYNTGTILCKSPKVVLFFLNLLTFLLVRFLLKIHLKHAIFQLLGPLILFDRTIKPRVNYN